MIADQPLPDLAGEIYASLAGGDAVTRIVLAESCTGGLAAAALVGLPGISQYLCGSAVVYRPDSKMQWLGVPAALIEEHSTESAEVTAALAIGVLERTPEANVAAAVTGHLENDSSRDHRAPHVFVAVASRCGSGSGVEIVRQQGFALVGSTRGDCQTEAAVRLLESLRTVLRKRHSEK